jgi:hypothetical protein
VRASGWWECFRRKKNWIRGQEKKNSKTKIEVRAEKREEKKNLPTTLVSTWTKRAPISAPSI